MTTRVETPARREIENIEVLIGRFGVGREILALEDVRMVLFAEGGHVWIRGRDVDGGAIADIGLEVDLKLARHLHMFGAVDGGATTAGNGTSALFEASLGLRWDF